MRWFPKKLFDVSFSRQLLTTFTIGIISLTVASTVILTKISSKVVEERIIEEGLHQANSFATQSTLALLYNSEETARESIETILTFPDLLGVEILDTGMKVLGSGGIALGAMNFRTNLPVKPVLSTQDEQSWEFTAPSYTGLADETDSPFYETNDGKQLIGYVRIKMSKQVLKSVKSSIFRYNLIVSFVLSSLILFILLIITNSVTRPIHRLADVMRRSQDGEKNLRAELKGASDIVEMETAFNSMMDVLEKREKALSLAKDQALESARMKGEFAANVSHELRTPMNGVLGMLELLSGIELSDKQNEYVNTAKNSGEALLALIDDILDFSKNESGKTTIDLIDFSLPDVLEEVVSLLSPQARQKNIDLAYVIDTDIPYNLTGDSSRIRQVLINLVSNALKFTQDGDVAIDVVLDDSDSTKVRLRFFVSDTGIGISQSAQDRIFEAFLQADGSTTRKYGGTGLGLSICRQLVQLMGGDIYVESEEGKGSKFWFDLPLLKQALEVGPTRSSDLRADVHRVLLVDDSILVQRFMTQLFAVEDIECVTAGNLETAVELFSDAIARNKPFKFVFVDEQVPPVSGQKVIQQLVDIDRSKYSHFISMTNQLLPDNNTLNGLFVSGNLHKPIKRADLYSCVNAILRPKNIITANDVGNASGQEQRTKPLNFTNNTILVAEDNRANQQVAIGMLERLGCSVEIANNGLECMSVLQQKSFDLVLMDCHMPQMDGYEATGHIRAMESTEERIAIVAMTANVLKGEHEKCVAAGMDDYLSKPLKLDTLSNMLEKWLSPEQSTVDEPAEYFEHGENLEIIDRNVIAELHSQIGDVMYPMVQAYLEDLPIYINALDEAIVAKSAKSFADTAHTIRGSSSNFGANRLVDVCQRLTDLGRAGTMEGAENLFKEIVAESGMVEQVLKQDYQLVARAKPKPEINHASDRKQHILIVDDDRVSRFTMSEVLRNDGYTVEEANNGRQAIVCCERNAPDLILMDAVMPEMDGFTACHIIKELPVGRDIPILIITALNDDSSISRAFSVGATDYISKPVNFSVLRQRIARLVQAHSTERHVKQLAYHDTLTQLPNRIKFAEQFETSAAATRSNDGKLALMFLDLDRFKLINDSLGHAAGDLLLKYFADRVQGCIRKGDIVSRFGGDEFTILLNNINSPENISGVVKKIQKQLASPFVFMGKEIYITTSIGITMYPNDGHEIGTLLKKADMAMYRAKEKGSLFEFYQPYMEDHISQRLDLENDLRGAVARGEFEVYYQPQELLASGEIYGMEALVRWNHPIRGLVSPLEFISMAEETGQILELGDWVLRQACQQLKTWIDQGNKPIRVAVNISAKQLADPNLVYSVSKVLEETALAPELLELEITESTIMEHPEQVMVTLQKLKQIGILLSIDDFGTGYSSLNYLKRFPIDIIKIDRSFISDIAASSVDTGIVTTIISLAHLLGVKVIAEGVETLQQKEILIRESCEIMQGYYLSKPVPAKEFSLQFLSPMKKQVNGSVVTALRFPNK